MAVITENGIVLRTLEEIVSDNTTLWSEKTGDFDVAPSSAGGEIIAIKSELDARFDQDIASAYIDNTIQASGSFLDLVGERKGVYRRINVPTVAVVSITGVNGTILVAGTTFTCSLNNEVFETQYQVEIAGGVAQVTVQSQNFGVLCPAQTLSIDPAVVGVTTATNEANGILGYEIESDESYRVRISQVGTEQTHIKDGLYFALLSLPGVAKARVIDNNTDAIIFGEIPARYFCPIVLGGNSIEVAQVVYNFMQNGNPSFGNEQNTILSDRGEPYLTYFSRAIEQSVTIEISYTSDSSFDTLSGEGVMINNVINLVNNLKIGETLFIQRLEAVCFIQGVTSVSITINTLSADIIPSYDSIVVTNETLVSIL